MESPIRYWIPLIASAVLFLTGVVYEGVISELPRGNPPLALMDYYNRHHRIATTINCLGGALLLLSLMVSLRNRKEK